MEIWEVLNYENIFINIAYRVYPWHKLLFIFGESFRE